MENEQPFAVQAALHRHFAREVAAPRGVALGALIRSDRDRLQFWDGCQVVGDTHVERKFVVGESERVVIEAAKLDPTLSAVLGYVVTPKHRPEEAAWLIRDGKVIDPARRIRRDNRAQGYLGVQLRATEVVNWTPTHPLAVAERGAHRQRLAA
ncbi:MAG TPA: hypothetical protein VH275_04585 [Solirubrobacterales bacterium]|nr:hypothetical protein [Solirubrobacterales bacterium]